MSKIIVKDREVTITGFSDDDYVSLTDIAKFLNNAIQDTQFKIG